MKTIKALCISLLTLPLFAGLASCSEDGAEYSSASKLKNAQVYFSNNEDTILEVDKSASSTTLKIYRQNTSGEVTVPLASTITGPLENVYTVPASVTFADGASEADINITYDAERVEYGQYDDITIAIDTAAVGAKDVTTVYGPASYTGQIGAAEPWSDWHFYNSEKTCTYHYGGFVIAGSEEDVAFRVSENQNDPNKVRIQVGPTWYGGSDGYFTLNWDKTTNKITIPEQYCASLSEQVGVNVYIMDMESYTGLSDYASTIDLKSGIITLNVILTNGVGGYYNGMHGTEYIYINGSEFVRTDYTAVLEYLGTSINPEGTRTLNVAAQLGADVAYANVALVPASDIESEEVVNAIAEGSYANVKTVEKSDAVYETIAFSNNGLKNNTEYVAMAVTFDEADNAQQVSVSTQFTYLSRITQSWEKVYTGNYGYQLFWGNQDADGNVEEYQAPYTVYQCVEDPTKFKISHWFDLGKQDYPTYNGVDFTFSMAASGKIMVDDINTGYYLNSEKYQGFVKVSEGKKRLTELSGFQSSYNADKGYFQFVLAYHVDDTNISGGYEFFYIDQPEDQARMRKAMAKARKAAAKKVYMQNPGVHIESAHRLGGKVAAKKHFTLSTSKKF